MLLPSPRLLPAPGLLPNMSRTEQSPAAGEPMGAVYVRPLPGVHIGFKGA